MPVALLAAVTTGATATGTELVATDATDTTEAELGAAAATETWLELLSADSGQ